MINAHHCPHCGRIQTPVFVHSLLRCGKCFSMLDDEAPFPTRPISKQETFHQPLIKARGGAIQKKTAAPKHVWVDPAWQEDCDC